jgi:hypothetical protein
MEDMAGLPRLLRSVSLYRILIRNAEGRYHFGDVRINRRMSFKLISKG